MDTTARLQVDYVYDPGVDDTLDWQIRSLLGLCFPGPLFRHKRYNKELPAHRWIVRENEHLLMAHAALHDKRIATPAGERRVGGVAEVCVHPHHRGRGLVKLLLDAMHHWMDAQGFDFALLFGKPEVYGSSGYRPVANPIRYFDVNQNAWIERTIPSAQVRARDGAAWPAGRIDLGCPMF